MTEEEMRDDIRTKALRYYLKDLLEVRDRTYRGKFVSKEHAHSLGLSGPSDIERLISETMKALDYPTNAFVDRVVWLLMMAADSSELWADGRKDAEKYREAVRQAMKEACR